MSAADEVERLREEAGCPRVCGKESACAGSSTCQANRIHRKTATLPARIAALERVAEAAKEVAECSMFAQCEQCGRKALCSALAALEATP